MTTDALTTEAVKRLEAACDAVCAFLRAVEWDNDSTETEAANLRYELTEAGARLRAQGTPQTEWQPIETAPKDGTRIVLTDGSGNADVGRWNGKRWVVAAYSVKPTLWYPLPSLPPDRPDPQEKA